MMMVISTIRSCKLVLLFLALSILSISALAEGSDNYSVNISANKFLGEYLVNQSGFTLYYFSDDSNGDGSSTCYDDCAATWPPFYTKELTLPDRLRSADFDSITRTDGIKQTTFRGWPLYLYSRDSAAGDVFGNNRQGLWHVVNPADLPQLF